jgi:hypothetical protein
VTAAAATGERGVAAAGRRRVASPPVAVLFALGALLSAATIWWEIGPHDEGLMLQAAHRIASGELPYRDFWWNYPPGQPLLLALPDLVVGPSLVPWRVLRVALDATVAVLAFALARRETGGGWLALLVWLAVAGAMAFPTGPGPNPTALALGLGALLAAPRRPVLAGALAGLAAFLRLEIGVAVALGAAALAPGDRRWGLAARCLGAAAAVGLAAWAPFVLAAPRAALDQTLGFLRIQHLQRLPFPLDPSGVGLDPNKLLELWMPAILVAACAAWAAHALVRRPPPPALAAAPLAVVGLAYLLGRTDEFHLVPLAVALPLLLAGAAAREPRRAVAAGLVALLALIALHGLERKAAQIAGRPPLAPVPGPAGDGVRTAAAEAAELRAVLAAVGGRSLFVVPPRLDRVTVGNPLLYVLAGRENPTRHDVIQPGVVTTEAVQREMIRDLERARPEVLVRWIDPRTGPEDNGSGRERGARLLDAHLARTYGPGRRIGSYVVAERR